jgi:hypothetical protein
MGECLNILHDLSTKNLLKNGFVSTLSPTAVKLATNYLKKVTTSLADDLAVEACSNTTHDLESTLEKNPTIDRVPALVAAAAAGQIGALDILLNTLLSRVHINTTITMSLKIPNKNGVIPSPAEQLLY